MAQASAARAGQSADRAAELQAKFIRGLADPTRLRIVGFLLNGPRSVSEIMAKLRLPQSRISNHLACLKWCGYVSTERLGRTVIYRIDDDRVRQILDLTRAIVVDNAEHIANCVRIDS